MSATHILNTSGGIYCGQRIVRGFVTLKEFQHFVEAKTLPTQIKTNVMHTCEIRMGDKCYKMGVMASCPRTKTERTRICLECKDRAEQNAFLSA